MTGETSGQNQVLVTSAGNGPAAERNLKMHDHYTVFSTTADEQQHTRLVIAADERDAIKTHRQHFPGCKVTGVIPNGKRK